MKKKFKKIADTFHQFMHDQIETIEKDKWLDSEKAGRDLGDPYIHDWIIHNAKKFRKEWLEKHKDVL